MVRVTSAEAQNRFGELLERVQREPVAVTRHGRTVAYVVAANAMPDPDDLAERRAAAVHWYAQYRHALAAVAPGPDPLTDADVDALVHALR